MSQRLRLHGGVPLSGTVAASGSKNATLPILAASLLADSPITLHGTPRLADVATLCRVLESLGVETVCSHDGALRIAMQDLRPTTAAAREVRRMRASFCVLGPLLARRGMARVALPGGCNLGHRPVDLHLKGLAALGAEITLSRGYVVAKANRLRGARIDLAGQRGPTVTGTANVLCAATLARGTTVIESAACEPEIADLARFLTGLGARIEGTGTQTLVVRGVDQLGGTTHRMIPDRIEAATLLIAGAITGGEIRITQAEPTHLHAVLSALDAAGVHVTVDADTIAISCDGTLRAVPVTARPYPGFPTDVAPLWMALGAVAAGRTVIRDEIFPTRWQHAAELGRLGAKIEISAGQATVVRSSLRGACVSASDLRGGAALVLAGLAAHGATTVRGLNHIDRGYERFNDKLLALGANVLQQSLAAHVTERHPIATVPR